MRKQWSCMVTTGGHWSRLVSTAHLRYGILGILWTQFLLNSSQMFFWSGSSDLLAGQCLSWFRLVLRDDLTSAIFSYNVPTPGNWAVEPILQVLAAHGLRSETRQGYRMYSNVTVMDGLGVSGLQRTHVHHGSPCLVQCLVQAFAKKFDSFGPSTGSALMRSKPVGTLSTPVFLRSRVQIFL